jgi:shikimate dehydrogenase
MPGSPHIDRYAVFGNPIAHSKSPTIHALFAEQTGEVLSYEKQLVEIGDFARSLRVFVDAGGCGANVTLPFKIEAWEAANVLTDRARAAGAVNTLSFTSGGIVGDNTDGIGLIADVAINAGVSIKGQRVLLIGAGGAAQGVMLPLLQMQPGELVIANRTVAKAAAIAARFNEHVQPSSCIHVAEFADLEGAFDIVINATAASLAGAVPDIPASIFDASTFAYDMMYGRAPTVFMQFASARNATVRDGLGMLVEQAAEAFNVWRNVRPATDKVLSILRASL